MRSTSKLRRGNALIAVLLLLRTVAFAEGCRPKKGTLGGDCQDNGCNAFCDDGSRCDNSTNTCVADTTPTNPPTGCNFNGADTRCSSGQTAYECLGGTTPTSENGVPGCRYVSHDGLGHALYCCTPTCAVYEARCGAPSTTYICSGSATPQDVDSSLTCVTRISYWGFTEYCCGTPDTCFAWSDLQAECPADDALMFCTGSAVPSRAGESCRASAADGGAGVRAYCCPPSAGDAGDSGLTRDDRRTGACLRHAAIAPRYARLARATASRLSWLSG